MHCPLRPQTLLVTVWLTVLLHPILATHICLIGSGIAAASTSHHLSTLTPSPNLTLFERSPIIGGRIHTFVHKTLHKTLHLEAGASIIATRNALLSSFATTLSLPRKTPLSSALGLWTGASFALRTHPSTPLRSKLSLLLRYRLSLLALPRFVEALLRVFDQLYPPGRTAHPTVQALFTPAASLYNLTQTPFRPTLTPHFAPRFIAELLSAIVRVNYGQDVSSMNALSGAIALAGSGDALWAVDGGNVRIVDGLLRSAGVSVHRAAAVDRVLVRDSVAKRYAVWAGGKEHACDAVALCAPFENANISVPDAFREKMDVGRTFHRTVATFVQGRLNTLTFGPSPPDMLLTIEGADEPFTSVGLAWVGNVSSGEHPIFKVFSERSLDDKAIGRVFEPGAIVIKEFSWLAYPNFSPPEKFAPFDVDPEGAFIYTSPIESAGSAMEMSAIAGANAAALIRDKLGLGDGDEGDGRKEEL